jgi:glycosyltransferase involved in cell wall biosynthesis
MRRGTRVHLSVIIPTLNRLETATLIAGRIKELFPSLQTEVIVVTPAAGERAISSEFLRFVADTGRGVYAAYNAGLRSANGEYVWFVGDDDYPLDASTEMSDILSAGSVDMLIAPVLFSSGRIYRPTRTLLLLHFLNWCQQGVIYRRKVLLRHRFFKRLTVQADQYVNILLRADPEVSRQFFAEPICVFGVNGVSGRVRDAGYGALRLALAHRTLGCGGFLAFRFLAAIEPLIKRFVKIR